METQTLKNANLRVVATLTAISVMSFPFLSAQAQDGSGTLYKSKCAGCHGVDGSGSATGKKMGAHDFTSVDVQGMSDAQLSTVITNGKNKMPAYGKSLKAEDITGLVAYIRTLKK
jgi:mono/diheme cytochrome c family protein